MIACCGPGSAAENLETGQKVAIKKVLNAFQDTLDAKRVLREVKLMKHFAHENVSRRVHCALYGPRLRSLMTEYAMACRW